MFQSSGANTLSLFRELFHRIPDGTFCYFGALGKDSQDLPDRNISCLFMPTVIIGYEGDRGVTNLSLPGKFRLGKVGHSDDIHPPCPVKPRFGPSLKIEVLRYRDRFRPYEQWHRLLSPPGKGSELRTGQTGSAKLIWPTIPSLKKVFGRPFVWSMNWFGITISPGWIDSFMDPTALTPMIHWTPSIFIP